MRGLASLLLPKYAFLDWRRITHPFWAAARIGDLWQTELSYGTVLRSLVSWLLEACGSCRNLKQKKQSQKLKR